MNWIHGTVTGTFKAKGFGELFIADLEKGNKEKQEAGSLLREFIQNALDAKSSNNDDDCVNVSVKEIEVPMHIIKKYGLDQLENIHINSYNGSQKAGKIFNENEYRKLFKSNKVRCLVMEDFGTTGLQGEIIPKDPLDKPDIRLFMEYEAITSKKGGNKSGSQGIGKTVFYTASSIGTILFMSTREENPKSIFSGISQYDGFRNVEGAYDGTSYLAQSIDPYKVPYTSEDFDRYEKNPEIISEFVKDFELSRKNNEKGLSIVIPFVKSYANEETLLYEIVSEFDFGILGKKLNFKFTNLKGETKSLNENTAINFSMDKTQRKYRTFIKEVYENENELPDFEINFGDKSISNSKDVNNFLEESIDSQEIEELKNKLEEKNLKIRVHQSIEKLKDYREEGELPQDGFFDTYIKKLNEPANYDNIRYYRGPLYIENSGKNHSENNCMIIITINGENPLADLLVQSERADHKNFYLNNPKPLYNLPSAVRIVTHSGAAISNLIFDPEIGEMHTDIFDEFFNTSKTGPGPNPPGPDVPDRGPQVVDWSKSRIYDDLGEIHIVFTDLKRKKRRLKKDEIITIEVGYKGSKTGKKINNDINTSYLEKNNKIYTENCTLSGTGGKKIHITNFDTEIDDNFTISITGLDKNRLPTFDVERLRYD